MYASYIANTAAWILSSFSHSDCNNMNGTYKRVGRQKGGVVGDGEGGQLEVG